MTLRILLLILLPVSAFAQYTVNFTSSAYTADLNVSVGKNIIYADIDVEISENVISEDFSVGFTDSRYKADVIIGTSSVSSDIKIFLGNSLSADLDIDISENQLYEDISIEIKSTGSVDYLVYNEDKFLSKEKLVVALLPIINAHLKYKFPKVPFWSRQKGLGSPEESFKPSLYCCPDLDHWVSSIKERVLTLEDGSVWLVYEDDQYITMLWLPIDNIKIKASGVYGHYYLSRYDSIMKKYETVRAIYVKN